MKNILLIGLLALSCCASLEAAQPNVVLIVADDLSAEYLSAYSRDGVKTPNLERMAAEGIRFTNYVSPSICAPARSALITSRSPRYTNSYHNQLDSRRLKQDVNDFLTIAKMFKDQGYSTCLTGKWNVGGKILHYDTARVWDYTLRSGVGMEDRGTASRYWYPGIKDESGARVGSRPSDFGPALFAQHGLEFIEEKLTAGEPFFYHYSMVEPHAIRGNDSPSIPGARGSSPRERYRNLISYMDQRVGDVLNAVAGTNTIVIFVADNPTATEGKSWATPKGMFVPCIVWGEGIASRGRSTEMFSAHDIMPTLGTAIGAPEFTTDGRSHYDYWTGAFHVTAKKKISYIGTSQILVTRKEFFVRDAVRGNAKGKLTRARGKKEMPKSAAHRRYSRNLTRWCGAMLRPNKGAMRGTGSFARRWVQVEKRERW